MLTIESSTISITRGDTGYIHLNLTKDNEAYPYEDGDMITMSVKKNDTDEEYAFQKEVPAGQVIILQPADTKTMEYGEYVYDIQLNTTLGEIFTVVGPAKFKVTKEITV